jgi:uncharacterized LabA/DUF88 family protein
LKALTSWTATGGVFFQVRGFLTSIEPDPKKAAFFFDGQNLFRAAKDLFDDDPYYHPSYDPLRLAEHICRENKWEMGPVQFYTGIPPRNEDSYWNDYWARKISYMKRRGVQTFTRHTRHGREKGIDVRIALDLIRLARTRKYNVAVIFSQDQDFSEVVCEIKDYCRMEDHWIGLYSAYPFAPDMAQTRPKINGRGIAGTNWIKIEKHVYDRCLDPNDYRKGSVIHP